MASSCGAFHEEALRRQRVIDKKRAAIHRLNIVKEEEERNAIEKARLDAEMKQKRHNDKMKELQKHLSAVKSDGKRGPAEIPGSVMTNIRRKEKALRNSNLLIGHPRALWDAR
ncbi:uncharacterized protein LOC143451792 [Clavelina lepadiformis]|uniref:uncharacterized protein LOC143451792 n=1 Tax=Clavelina lepadiformis TaxID=159417 RepID=UPI00404292B6